MITSRDEYIEWVNRIIKARPSNFRASQEFTNLLLSELVSVLWAVHDGSCYGSTPLFDTEQKVHLADLVNGFQKGENIDGN